MGSVAAVTHAHNAIVSTTAPIAPALPPAAPGAPGRLTSPGRVRVLLVLALLLPLALTVVLHALSLQRAPAPGGGLLELTQAWRVDERGTVPPQAGQGHEVSLPLHEPPGLVAPPRPQWFVLRFELERAADTTWALDLGHRTPVLVYLDGRLLANSVPLAEADLPPRNLQIGDRRLSVNVPADWLGAGPHELALRVGAAGPSGISVSRPLLGPEPLVEAADRPRRLWSGLRTATALSALVIGTLLMFTWLVERRERLYLWSAVHLVMLALLLSPYVLDEPPLPAPWWRMLLDAADVLAKGIAPVVIAAWARPQQAWVPRVAFAYLAVALPVDLLAAYLQLPWARFAHPWPWWALASRLAMLVLALVLALQALAARPGPLRFGTAAMVGLALWIWADVSLFAIVLPGTVRVVDLNVFAYAGWALWVAVLLHQRLVRGRQRELRLRVELARQLDERSRELDAQYAALQAAEQARTAATERERLLQEMHDGLGSSLMTAKMRAATGELSSHEMVDALDGCLREMRLAVDTLSVTDGDLGLLLGNLRHRLGPGLSGAGLTLHWALADSPCVPALEGSGGRELVRIVQEVFANVMHHAGATQVTLATVRLPPLAPGAPERVGLSVRDDGRGMPESPSLGRGLRGIRRRAERLGATVAWSAPAEGSGTVFTLELPLGPPLGPPTSP